jgi:beta-N-acetylglucosaminidase
MVDNKEIVTYEKLMMAQMIQLDAISQLLIEKGILAE